MGSGEGKERTVGPGGTGLEREEEDGCRGTMYLDSSSVASSGLQTQDELKWVREGLASRAGCSPLGRWASFSPVQEARGGWCSPATSAPAPSLSWSFKQRGQPGKICCKPPVREGAQVTTAPGNRSPGNHWQLQKLRHCLAPTQHSAGPLTCPGPKSPNLVLARPG